MSESILTSIKKQSGIEESYTHFDPDMIMHVNTVFSILTQMGVGPTEGFSITDKTETWSDFIPDDKRMRAVETYIGLKVRLIFDPPSTVKMEVRVMEHDLKHYGILGMRWGVRRSPAQLDRVNSSKKKNIDSSGEGVKKTSSTTVRKTSSTTVKKSIKDFSDDDLKKKISRLELEKKYKDLNPTSGKSKKGKDFVMRVLERSGENIATQLTTYGMGVAVNKLFDMEIVNPKKGQKDK